MKNKWLFLMLVAMCHLQAQIPTAGLIGEWLFNGNANDNSTSANHGTVIGASLTTDRCGNPNSAYSFNGFSSYIITSQVGPTGSAPRSLSFWARTSNTVINNPKVAFDYGLNSGNGDTWQVVWNYCGGGVGLDMSNQAIIKGNYCLLDGNWHHIVIVHNPTVTNVFSQAEFYFDGVLQGSNLCNVSGTNAAVNTGTTYPITIGRGVTPVRYFNGDLDDFRLYNRALTAAEVLQLLITCQPPVIGSPSACAGASLVYSVQGTPGAVYSWTLPPGWTGSSITNTILVTAGNTGGTIGVSSMNGFCPQSGISTTVVNISALSVSVATTPSLVCAGGTATLTGTGATSYSWLPGNATGSTIVVSPGISTTYTVMALDNAGCSGSQTATVSVKGMSISAASKVICKGSALSLTGSGASSYTWQPGNLTGPTVSVVPLSNASYTLSGSVLGCPNVMTSVFSVTLSSCTALNREDGEEIKIGPVPAGDQIRISLNEPAELRLYGGTGTLIRNFGLGEGSRELSLAGLPAGIYYLVLNGLEQTKVFRVIKQ